MKNFISVKPEKARLVNLLDEIEKGEIKIPIFQRSLVWTEIQMRELFDSITKGYPIGSVLLWLPKEDFKCYEYFGPYITNSNFDKQTKYILDGSQRLSTLYGVLSNPNTHKIYENQKLKKFSLFYNLKDEEFTYTKTKSNLKYLIPLYSIVDTFEFLDFLKRLQDAIEDDSERERLINNAKTINKILIDYEIPYTIINGGDINSAVEIFSRVNSTGTEISEDWMLSALLYNNVSNFLLSEKITKFLDQMKQYNFDNLKRDTILNCIACACDDKKVFFDVKVEELANKNKNEFEEITTSTLWNVERAIRFLYGELCVIDYKLLPYPSQLVFITEFFRLNPKSSPDQELKLKKWFWITSYSNYFTIYSLSQQRNAFKIFRKFAVGEHIDGIFELEMSSTFFTQKFPLEITYSSVRSKTLQLFLLNNVKRHTTIEKEDESVKEQFIFFYKDRRVGNMILRFSSEFEIAKKAENTVFYAMENENLSDYFMTQELIQLFIDKNIDLFLSKRQSFIIQKEKQFVVSLGINYIN